MDQILKDLGGLVLGSVPTMILFILLVILYGLLVRRPLDRILAERRARTTGAIEAETQVYEDKLRAARAEIFEARAEKLRQWNAEREAALADVRTTAQKRIQAAREEIEQTATTARQQIEGLSSALSDEILRAVLPKGISPEATQ
jgi:F-type H+-transporting ATPase subunit b